MVTHSSILAWKIPWTEEPDGLLSTWLQRGDMTEQLTLSLLSVFLRLKVYLSFSGGLIALVKASFSNLLFVPIALGFFLMYFFFFLATCHSLQDLSCPTRDQTWALCRNIES